MEELDYWRFCEELNIVQASLLVVGEDPSCAGYTEDQEIQNRPKGYEAVKLAASVKAWQAITNAGKRSPKQALDKWLREHAAEFGLTSEDGSPIENAIQECSKVANWNTKGGATKTPT